jgi:hypothetical protein
MADTDEKIKLLIFKLTEKADRFYWFKNSSGWCISHEAGYRILIGEDARLRVITEFEETMIPEEDLNKEQTLPMRKNLVSVVSKLWSDRNELIDAVLKELDKL